jgi:hypothetical protein
VTATFAVTEINQIYQTNSIHTFLAPEQRATPRVKVSPDNESREEQIIMQGTVKESNHTIPLKELLVDELRDLRHAEGQLVRNPSPR